MMLQEKVLILMTILQDENVSLCANKVEKTREWHKNFFPST